MRRVRIPTRLSGDTLQVEHRDDAGSEPAPGFDLAPVAAECGCSASASALLTPSHVSWTMHRFLIEVAFLMTKPVSPDDMKTILTSSLRSAAGFIRETRSTISSIRPRCRAS